MHYRAILYAHFMISIGGVTQHAAAQTTVKRDDYIDCVVKSKSEIELGSPEDGIIKQFKVDRGDVVKKGQIVAVLESKLQRLEVDIARIRAESKVNIRSAEARLEFRKTETKRAETLHEKKIVSTKLLDEAEIEGRLAELEVETAELEHRLAQAELARIRERLARRSIRSPVKGIVVELKMSLGEFAYEQVPVMTIAEIDPLYIEAFAPVEIYDRIKSGNTAEILVGAPFKAIYRAKVTVVDRVFDPASRTFGVRMELPNPEYQIPAGLNCRVRFLSESQSGN